MNNKRELIQKLKRLLREGLPYDLFKASEIHSLDEMSQYVHFIDNIRSRNELIRGFKALSPFADDALAVAKGMTEQDFWSFKLALPSERRGEGGKMPECFGTLLLPDRFLGAISLAEKAATPLGTALVRILETELGI